MWIYFVNMYYGLRIIALCIMDYVLYVYCALVYTTQVIGAIWLVPLSLDIKYYSPPGSFRVKKNVARDPFHGKIK